MLCPYSFCFFSNKAANFLIVSSEYTTPDGLFGELIKTAFVFFEIVYDGFEVPYVPHYYKNTLVGYSFSKSLSIPGERVGYIVAPTEAISKYIFAPFNLSA